MFMKPGGEGGDSGHSLCTGDVPLLTVYLFHNFCLGRVLFSGPTVWQRVCFDPGLITEILARVAILPYSSGKGENFLSGKGKGMPPWAAHRYP